MEPMYGFVIGVVVMSLVILLKEQFEPEKFEFPKAIYDWERDGI